MASSLASSSQCAHWKSTDLLPTTDSIVDLLLIVLPASPRLGSSFSCETSLFISDVLFHHTFRCQASSDLLPDLVAKSPPRRLKPKLLNFLNFSYHAPNPALQLGFTSTSSVSSWRLLLRPLRALLHPLRRNATRSSVIHLDCTA